MEKEKKNVAVQVSQGEKSGLPVGLSSMKTKKEKNPLPGLKFAVPGKMIGGKSAGGLRTRGGTSD